MNTVKRIATIVVITLIVTIISSCVVGCSISNMATRASVPVKEEQVQEQAVQVELFYGTADYSVDRRADMQAQWALLNSAS